MSLLSPILLGLLVLGAMVLLTTLALVVLQERRELTAGAKERGDAPTLSPAFPEAA